MAWKRCCHWLACMTLQGSLIINHVKWLVHVCNLAGTTGIRWELLNVRLFQYNACIIHCGSEIVLFSCIALCQRTVHAVITLPFVRLSLSLSAVLKWLNMSSPRDRPRILIFLLLSIRAEWQNSYTVTLTEISNRVWVWKVHDIKASISHYLWNNTRWQWHGYYGMLIRSRTWFAELCYFQWPSLIFKSHLSCRKSFGAIVWKHLAYCLQD